MSTETATHVDVAPRFYDYREVYPFLEHLKENQDALIAEMDRACKSGSWVDWPERDLYGEETDWDVIPFIAFNKKVDKNCERCPETTKLLLSIPELRVAVYSRLGPQSELTPHYGLAPLANDALRCHFGLRVPEECGIWVEGEMRTQEVGEFIIFDDSKYHSAFNLSDQERIVLLMDFNRPAAIPRGTSEFGLTAELDDLIQQFLPDASPLDAQ